MWFVGTHEEVKAREKDAAELMARVEVGEEINLSSISLGASTTNIDQKPTTWSDAPSAQEQYIIFSDCETEHVIAPSKRKQHQVASKKS